MPAYVRLTEERHRIARTEIFVFKIKECPENCAKSFVVLVERKTVAGRTKGCYHLPLESRRTKVLLLLLLTFSPWRTALFDDILVSIALYKS
jgi:hypothetical protein